MMHHNKKNENHLWDQKKLLEMWERAAESLFAFQRSPCFSALVRWIGKVSLLTLDILVKRLISNVLTLIFKFFGGWKF